MHVSRLLVLAAASTACACSNIMVTPGASKDGRVLIGDNDDSARRHGLVSHWPAADHPPGATKKVFDFDTGELNGVISEAAHTFNVVSRANEKGVVMAETTHGGLANLTGGNGTIMDYGSLMVTTLQRSSTAREAVRMVAHLAGKYGYASSMEGFSISDGTECW